VWFIDPACLCVCVCICMCVCVYVCVWHRFWRDILLGSKHKFDFQEVSLTERPKNGVGLYRERSCARHIRYVSYMQYTKCVMCLCMCVYVCMCMRLVCDGFLPFPLCFSLFLLFFSCLSRHTHTHAHILINTRKTGILFGVNRQSTTV